MTTKTRKKTRKKNSNNSINKNNQRKNHDDNNNTCLWRCPFNPVPRDKIIWVGESVHCCWCPHRMIPRSKLFFSRSKLCKIRLRKIKVGRIVTTGFCLINRSLRSKSPHFKSFISLLFFLMAALFLSLADWCQKNCLHLPSDYLSFLKLFLTVPSYMKTTKWSRVTQFYFKRITPDKIKLNKIKKKNPTERI